MNRTMMLTLIALTVTSLSFVCVSEASTGRAEPAVPAIAEDSGLENANATPIDTHALSEGTGTTTVDTGTTTVDNSSVEVGIATFELGPRLPLPTDCTPGSYCSNDGACGWDPDSNCPLGQCVAQTCYCY